MGEDLRNLKDCYGGMVLSSFQRSPRMSIPQPFQSLIAILPEEMKGLVKSVTLRRIIWASCLQLLLSSFILSLPSTQEVKVLQALGLILVAESGTYRMVMCFMLRFT